MSAAARETAYGVLGLNGVCSPTKPLQLPYTSGVEAFARNQSPAAMAMFSGETIWDYGCPSRVDSLALLRELADDDVRSSDGETVVLPVAEVVAMARHRFGAADDHTIEAHFDAMLIELNSTRDAAPDAYRVPLHVLIAV